jgi:amino acid permease
MKQRQAPGRHRKWGNEIHLDQGTSSHSRLIAQYKEEGPLPFLPSDPTNNMSDTKTDEDVGIEKQQEHKVSSLRGDESDNSFTYDEQLLKEQLGYTPEKALARNRSLYTLLFQSLAIAAIPYGEGAPLISAIYGGGQLSIFLGWIVVCILDECIALSLAELASRWPTSSGPSYWSYQLSKKNKSLAAYATGWVWLIGNSEYRVS